MSYSEAKTFEGIRNFGRHFVGMLTKCHVGEVQQPAGPKIIRVFFELFH